MHANDQCSCETYGLPCDAVHSPSCPAFAATPSSACILDAGGVIVRTNGAWDGFAGAQGCASTPCLGNGTNYLQVCARAALAGDPDADAVEERLRAVLDGLMDAFTLEYPCVTPRETRWYVLRVSAFRHEGRRWAVVVHDDITKHVTNEAALQRANTALGDIASRRADELRLADERARLIARVSSDGIWEWHPADDRLFPSDHMAALLGGARPETGTDLWALVHREDADRVAAVVRQRLKPDAAFETECRFQRPDGIVVWGLLRGHALAERPGGAVTRVVGTLSDITMRREAEEIVRTGASRDPLTQLPTRTVFMDRLAQALRHRDGAPLSVLLIDLDGFSDINQRYGYRAGNDTIREAAWRIAQAIGEDSCVSRIGGDEFAVFCPDDSEQSAERARAIAARLAEPLAGDPGGRALTASIGMVTALPEHGPDDAEELVAEADLAMLAAKKDGGNTQRRFEPEMRRASLKRFHLAGGMRDALAQAGRGDPPGFHLVYQPIFDLTSGAVAGFEALMRWGHPVLGPLNPAEFIPVAEQTGMIVALGDWAMRHACRQLAAWFAAGTVRGRPFMGVNVAAQQLYQPDFEAKVLSCIEESGLEPRALKIEVTEASLLDNTFAAVSVLSALRARGVRLSIDDFGTGFSSLSYLSRFPFDELKVDRSFVQDMLGNRRSLEVVRTIVGLGRGLDMTVVAEGVEQESERAMLRDLGCHQVQGYLLGRPVRADAVCTLVAGQQA